MMDHKGIAYAFLQKAFTLAATGNTPVVFGPGENWPEGIIRRIWCRVWASAITLNSGSGIAGGSLGSLGGASDTASGCSGCVKVAAGGTIEVGQPPIATPGGPTALPAIIAALAANALINDVTQSRTYDDFNPDGLVRMTSTLKPHKDLEVRGNFDVQFNKDGLVTRCGLSLTTDPENMATVMLGRWDSFRELHGRLPDSLTMRVDPKDRTHVTVEPADPMTLDHFRSLIDQIQLGPHQMLGPRY